MALAKLLGVAALALSASLSAQPALAAGDAEEGEKVFRKCKACHVVSEEQNRVGPHLVGLFGREAGSLEGFRYSDALKEADVVWNEETLAAFLADPRGYIPGNRMTFAGLRDEEDIQDVIAYLKAETQ
ncbi:MAG: cytochrome c family protein [Rhodovibrionaceae bacterium]|nr:cytochrome c family protein [Rhodovibrionaceae bacterium]